MRIPPLIYDGKRKIKRRGENRATGFHRGNRGGNLRGGGGVDLV